MNIYSAKLLWQQTSAVRERKAREKKEVDSIVDDFLKAIHEAILVGEKIVELELGRDMSKKFYAEDRVTGQRWEPERGKKQYLVMYDSGYLAVVTEDYYTYIKPLDPKKWAVRQKT